MPPFARRSISRSISLASVLAAAAAPAIAVPPSSVSDYSRLETPDAYIFMDRNGVALKVERKWACRNIEADPQGAPLVMDRPGHDAFLAAHSADAGDWNCQETAGRVLYSRELQAAQRALNTVPGRPRCAPAIPETGRYNWEMLDYDRCALSVEVSEARLEFKKDFVAWLAYLLHQDVPAALNSENVDAALTTIASQAKAEPVFRHAEACGKVIDNVYDYVACRMDARDSCLREAEESLREVSLRTDRLTERDFIDPVVMTAVEADMTLTRKWLGRAASEAQGT